jgi:hypothetical protein
MLSAVSLSSTALRMQREILGTLHLGMLRILSSKGMSFEKLEWSWLQFKARTHKILSI